MSALSPAATPSKENDNEVSFLLDEIFFSRTDPRGVIVNGNGIFERVSGYEMSELIGAPHKVVRHAEMPKGVFWLFWNRLGAGSPIGAYVKNRSKDGGYYWVFAIATPLEDGFISVRIKPTSPLLAKVIDLYAEMLERERSLDCSPEESAQHLLGKLGEMGFPDYESFMAHALAEESKARNASLGRAPNANLANYSDMGQCLDTILKLGLEIQQGFNRIQTSPLNMRIKSVRMGDIAAPLTAVLASFDTLNDKIRASINGFLDCSETARKNVNDGLFVNCANDIQKETINRFRSDDSPGEHEAIVYEAEQLHNLNVQYANKIRDALHRIQIETKRFFDMAVLLKRTLSGLSVTSILCQIESARLDDPSGGIDEVISQLRRFQELTSDCLAKIEDENDKIKCDVEKISLVIGEEPIEPEAFEFSKPPVTRERRSRQRAEA
ncbi:MAG: PAS domain-containing protein [Sulfitobacter sp.]